MVDGSDLSMFLTQWGCFAPAICPADLDGDGIVDGADLAVLLNNWG